MVSVNEIKNVENIPDNILKEMFTKQKELAMKYVEIEGMGNLFEKTNTNVDTLEGQIWLKDFLYRTIEEVGESFEVILLNQHWNNIPDIDKIHYAEELIDALHFFLELCLIAGYNFDNFKQISEYGIVRNTELNMRAFKVRHWNIVQNLTLAGNKLRNKKWKQTQVLTDRKIFFHYLEQAFDELIRALRTVGLTDEDIYNLYFKKNQVNKFRQRSQY